MKFTEYVKSRKIIGSMDGEISNIKKWIILYPIYINSKKTIAEGRRISTSKACENPTCAEIGDCCSHLKLPLIRHAYPRDFMQQGRVRVLLKSEDETFSNPAISSRKQLMLRIAELVPRHPGRTKKQEPAAASTSGAVPSKSGKEEVLHPLFSSPNTSNYSESSSCYFFFPLCVCVCSSTIYIL
ncbi:hypothetical protein HYC85_025779 [Camellia sinensis]|uniref:Signal recognition particle 19 kDa protein n=1 Tax=Camellia sinensis TaxID=4442 RepID=A0A7J7GBX4_CAMSI|nr:hypothetical protein HYC85_025779 [Camellia sinensis]